MGKDELDNNYKILVKWTIDREAARTEKGKREYLAGLGRIEDYEIEMRNRNYTTEMIHELYVATVFDGQLPTDFTH